MKKYEYKFVEVKSELGIKVKKATLLKNANK